MLSYQEFCKSLNEAKVNEKLGDGGVFTNFIDFAVAIYEAQVDRFNETGKIFSPKTYMIYMRPLGALKKGIENSPYLNGEKTAVKITSYSKKLTYNYADDMTAATGGTWAPSARKNEYMYLSEIMNTIPNYQTDPDQKEIYEKVVRYLPFYEKINAKGALMHYCNCPTVETFWSLVFDIDNNTGTWNIYDVKDPASRLAAYRDDTFTPYINDTDRILPQNRADIDPDDTTSLTYFDRRAARAASTPASPDASKYNAHTIDRIGYIQVAAGAGLSAKGYIYDGRSELALGPGATIPAALMTDVVNKIDKKVDSFKIKHGIE